MNVRLTRGDLRADVRQRLGDLAKEVWSDAEINIRLDEAYEDIATDINVFFDQVYLENLPPAFNHTAPWETKYLSALGGWDTGVTANFTYPDERALYGNLGIDDRSRYGPANATSWFEVTQGYLGRSLARTDIPATAELPADLMTIVRATWDRRGIDAMEARRLAGVDSRYEITVGEVYGYIWQKDGLRTLRKVRVPGQQADTVDVDGTWGILRTVSDLTGDTVTSTAAIPRLFSRNHAWESDYGFFPDRGQANYTAAWETTDGATAFTFETSVGPAWYTAPFEYTDGELTRLGLDTANPSANSWGIPRTIPSHHPIGPDLFGTPRRVFLDGNNFRVEHFRYGRPFSGDQSECELPYRYALYLRDYAQWRLLERPGPGQDVKLSQHFKERWTRDLARVMRRVQTVEAERMVVFGDVGPSSVQRPPRPKLPWNYGSVVR